MDIGVIRDDFDRLAPLLSDEPGPYDDFVFSLVPSPCARALEVGCGMGHFARRLARRCERVLAIDLSPMMIEIARRDAPENLEHRVADAQRIDFEREFDLVVSLTTLHHLSFEATLERLARALRPGGLLVVHDIADNRSLVGRLASAADFVLSLPRRARVSPELRAAWSAHEAHDHFVPFAEIRRRARGVLPGVRVRRHLRWRYTLSWQRPFGQ